MNKKLLIFFSRSQDQHQSVSAYHHFASDHARAIGLMLSITDIDVDPGNPQDLEFWNGDCTIECVGINDDGPVRAGCNPSLDNLGALLDTL